MKRILDAAMLSTLAHKTEEEVKKSLQTTDYEFQKFVSDGFLQCYIAKEKGTKNQVVVFRESTDRKDWYANISFLPIVTSYGIFHGAYFKKLRRVRAEIMLNIEDKNFVCIGFSQGAALARMFAHMIRKREIISNYNPFFISFEPPQESKTINYNTYGIYTTKGNDPVPFLPLALTGWNQSGEHIYITGHGGKFIPNPKKYKKWLKIASDTIMDFKDDGKFTTEDILRDHSIFEIQKHWEKEKNKEIILKLANSILV